jgi:hypothetical protein
MQFQHFFAIATTMLLSITSLQLHAAGNFQPNGHIQNDRGESCTYTQATDPKSTYFHGTLTSRTGAITFDNPTCMSESDVGLDVNKMMINNVISRWYSHSDAAFQTRVSELYPGSMMQKKGSCIQSQKYPAIGIAIDYEIRNGSIVSVRHSSSVQGCTR